MYSTLVNMGVLNLMKDFVSKDKPNIVWYSLHKDNNPIDFCISRPTDITT